MTRVRFREHNQGDKAVEQGGYDIACLSERSPHGPPRHMERHFSRYLKGLAIDWDPDVFDVHRTRAHIAHPGIPRRSPRRGTLVDRGRVDGVKVAVICSHRINNASGPTRRPKRWLAERLWARHARLDARLARNLIRKGYVVLYGGDINNHHANLDPLTRATRTFGHYDAVGYGPGAHLESCQPGPKGDSDHVRFDATFNIKEHR